MSNSLDSNYQQLLQDILDFGVEKQTRNGGTKSIFGYTIRHNMQDGFPLLTTKKMAWNTMVTELLWFLRGDTNIKFLVDNDCHIWDGDVYKNYLYKVIRDKNIVGYLKSYSVDTNGVPTIEPYSKEEFIERIKNDNEFAKKWGELGPIYGKQWRSWTKKKMYLSTDGSYENIYDEADQTVIDQISILINDLKTNPDSRRLMVSAWNVGELDQMVLPPCHYSFQVYTRELSLEERLEIFIKSQNLKEYEGEVQEIIDMNNTPKRAISLMWNQRSVDTFLGLPFNIASYGLLLEIIAKIVNMVPDELIGNLGDVHLYSNHIEQAKEQINREPFELPTLNINTEFWPYESGECGIGPINTTAVLNAFQDSNFSKCLLNEDIQLGNYQSHPAIKAPLSN
jgi:thymidylate synthase